MDHRTVLTSPKIQDKASVVVQGWQADNYQELVSPIWIHYLPVQVLTLKEATSAFFHFMGSFPIFTDFAYELSLAVIHFHSVQISDFPHLFCQSMHAILKTLQVFHCHPGSHTWSCSSCALFHTNFHSLYGSFNIRRLDLARTSTFYSLLVSSQNDFFQDSTWVMISTSWPHAVMISYFLACIAMPIPVMRTWHVIRWILQTRTFSGKLEFQEILFSSIMHA